MVLRSLSSLPLKIFTLEDDTTSPGKFAYHIVYPLFAYHIAKTELGHIQSHPGFKQFINVSSSPTLIPPEEVTLLHTLPTVHNCIQ